MNCGLTGQDVLPSLNPYPFGQSLVHATVRLLQKTFEWMALYGLAMDAGTVVEYKEVDPSTK
jgi:hypothetical protein